MIDFEATFIKSLPLGEFVEQFATPEQRDRWDHARKSVNLQPDQTELLSSYTREMNVLCLAGAWCGDCITQCPIFEKFAKTSSKIKPRFLDREAAGEVADHLKICGGKRVPAVVFLSEDFVECGRYGERTLAAYRRAAIAELGSAFPTKMTQIEDFQREVIADWFREFERIQLMLRLSPRLRQRHGD